MAGKRGLSLLEILMVVGILAIVSSAAVPYAEITFVRGKESELQANLALLRGAIKQWRVDCEAAATRRGRETVASMQECYFYPASLNYLTVASTTYIPAKNMANQSVAFNFNHPAYLAVVPTDPFVGYATWTLTFASPGMSLGIIDVSPVADPTTRRGFTDAIDGTKYQDW